MHMDFHIATNAVTPIYRQIVDQVQRWVASGQVRAGDELPSVRALALQHAINPMTVSKAYSLLEADGLLERRRGLGMVIAARSAGAHARQHKLELLQPALETAAQAARQLGLTDAQALAAFESCLKHTHPEGNSNEER